MMDPFDPNRGVFRYGYIRKELLELSEMLAAIFLTSSSPHDGISSGDGVAIKGDSAK